MKFRNLALLTVLLLSTITIQAQRFKGGIIAGLNASQIDGDTWGGFYKGGIMAGAFVNTDLQDKFGAQLEIKYSAKGSAPYIYSNDTRKIKLNYIDMPVLGTFEPKTNLKLEAGLSFNYLFNAEYFDGAWFDFGDDGPNPFETALVFGINYRFFTRFDLNIRFNYSLMPIRGEYAGSNWGDGAWSNQVISFGLYFHLGSQN